MYTSEYIYKVLQHTSEYIYKVLQHTCTRISYNTFTHTKHIRTHAYIATQIYACPIARIRVADLVHLHVYIHIFKVPRQDVAAVVQGTCSCPTRPTCSSSTTRIYPLNLMHIHTFKVPRHQLARVL